MSVFVDEDDSFDAVFAANRASIRTCALRHLREHAHHLAVLVELFDAGPNLAESVGGFSDVAAARAELADAGRSPGRRVFLVLRPEGVDLTRPSRPPVEVEWLDGGRAHGARIVA